MTVMIPKPTKIKKPEISRSNTEAVVVSGINADAIFKELEIAERTQLPPSEELISKLNQLASKPPFSYTQKVKKNYLL